MDKRPAFLHSHVHSSPLSRLLHNGRYLRTAGIVGLFTFLSIVLLNGLRHSTSVDWQDSFGVVPNSYINASKLHVLLPATAQDVNLCKTMLGLHVLGYPSPTMLGFQDQADRMYSVDDGAHILAKITKPLEYLEQLPDPAQDDELVIMVDGYDTWFQLRPEVLISRYHHINRVANQKLRARLGRGAMRAADIKQTVVFSASKTCSNQAHTLGCYPIPDPYTPEDMYGGNTDTSMGRTPNSSKRPRYLSSGYMMGPAKDIRAILRRAQLKVDTLPDFDRNLDNGSGDSDFLYHGHATSVFARIFGEQEYQREVLRRRHGGSGSWDGRWLGVGSSKAGQSFVAGTFMKDILKPTFTHEEMPRPTSESKHDQAREFEFGIGLDYGSDMGMQTDNAERDYGYIVYSNHTEILGESPKVLEHQQEDDAPRPKDEPMTALEQIQEAWPDRNMFDCPVHLHEILPRDITTSKLPYAAAPQIIVTDDGGQSPQDAPSNTSWAQVRLYTNLCLGSVPVMIHHNGDRELRERDWERLWWQRYGSTLLELAKMERKRKPISWQRGSPDATISDVGVGAWSDKGWYFEWDQLCPKGMESELFRGMEFD